MPQDDAIGAELRLRWAFYVGDNVLKAKGVRRFLLSSCKSNRQEHSMGTAHSGVLNHGCLGQRRAKEEDRLHRESERSVQPTHLDEDRRPDRPEDRT